jgi:hypothetical protein
VTVGTGEEEDMDGGGTGCRWMVAASLMEFDLSQYTLSTCARVLYNATLAY